MILWGVRTMAPAVPPGRYSVRLAVGGRVATTEVDRWSGIRGLRG